MKIIDGIKCPECGSKDVLLMDFYPCVEYECAGDIISEFQCQKCGFEWETSEEGY